jgi:hypothetical protein
LWLKILDIFRRFDVKCVKLIPTNADFLARCNTDSDSDKIFSAECIDALKLLSCEPVMPPDLRAKRTVIVRNVDDHAFQNEIPVFKEELARCNNWLKISDMFKLPNFNGIKLICESSDMAKKCTSDGILMFNLSIPPSDIKQDNYVHVSYCFKCYDINSHLSKDCPQSSDYKVCSLCAGEGPTF